MLDEAPRQLKQGATWIDVDTVKQRAVLRWIDELTGKRKAIFYAKFKDLPDWLQARANARSELRKSNKSKRSAGVAVSGTGNRRAKAKLEEHAST